MGRARLAVVAIALLIAADPARAQETSCALSGSVVSRSMQTGALVDGAAVSMPRLGKSVLSDSAGGFRLGAIPCGRHEVQIRKIGFTVWRDTVELSPGQELKRVYTLVSVAQLDTVRVDSDEIEYQSPRLQDFEARRKKNVGGYFISEATLRQMESQSMMTILRRMPGVGIVPYNGQNYVRSRGAGTSDQPLPGRKGAPQGCWAPVYLDGLLIFDGQLDQFRPTPPDIAQFFPLNLSGIEYYPSAGSMPLQFKTTKSNCGVLLLWSRGR